MDANGHIQAIRLTIPARPEYITLGRLALTGRLRARGLVVRRDRGGGHHGHGHACTNSVRHAYADGQGSVQILYELHADRLVVEVSDDGEGFEPPAVPSEALDGEELSEGGLGIAIIEALADELEIRERAQGGSSLRFVKLL